MIKRRVLSTVNSTRAVLYSKSSSTSDHLSKSSSSPLPSADVPGLSKAVVLPASGPVGPNVDPNKSGPYKVPEYYCYNTMSYFEAEIEMAKYRLPQPSAIKK